MELFDSLTPALFLLASMFILIVSVRKSFRTLNINEGYPAIQEEKEYSGPFADQLSNR